MLVTCRIYRCDQSAHVRIRVTGGCRVESKFFGIGDVSRGKHEGLRATGCPEGGVGVQGRGGIRGGARWGEERAAERGAWRERGMADHARSIYQNTPATRAHVHTYTRARARTLSRSHVHPPALSIYALTYANCKYNLSGPPCTRNCVDAHVRIVNAAFSRER